MIIIHMLSKKYLYVIIISWCFIIHDLFTTNIFIINYVIYYLLNNKTEFHLSGISLW